MLTIDMVIIANCLVQMPDKLRIFNELCMVKSTIVNADETELIWDIVAFLENLDRSVRIALKHSFGGFIAYADGKVHGANMEPTWVLSAPNGPHVGPMNLLSL